MKVGAEAPQVSKAVGVCALQWVRYHLYEVGVIALKANKD